MGVKRHSRRPYQASNAASLLSMAWFLFSSPAASTTIDCSHIRVDRQSFDLSSLSGNHSIHYVASHPPVTINTTITLDVCKPIRWDPHVPREQRCRQGTQICAVQRDRHDDEKDKGNWDTIGVIPIAGDFPHHGLSLDPKWTRLKTSSSNADAGKEGIRLELHGGRYGRPSRKQRAIIEFVCDRDRTGLEGLVDGSGKTTVEGFSLAQRPSEEIVAFDDDHDDDDDDDRDDDDSPTPPEDDPDNDDEGDDGKSLRYLSYGPTSDDIKEDTLRLEWRTKYACEGIRDEEGNKGSSSSHWGFFTWFIIILFLLVASYLIFGSWLNYNRYGARGWDLLPHSDTICDVPYLLKDFGRRVINTVQGSRGGGSRGGYSAV